MWLQRIKLWEFANLPWGQWMSNPNSYSQVEYLPRTGGVTINEVKITPSVIFEVFKLPLGEVGVSVVSDSVMKKEFGPPTAARAYYQLKQVEYGRRVQLKWYLEKLCLLLKYDYMSKEAFSPLHAVERGVSFSWAHFLYDKIMSDVEGRDKRKTVNRRRLAPYL